MGVQHVVLTLLLASVTLGTQTGTTTPQHRSHITSPQQVQKASTALLKQVLIDDYLAWHTANRLTAKRLVLRLQRAQPGIGDRFSSLLQAYVLAVFSQRILLIDWTYPYNICDFFVSNSHARIYFDANTDMPRLNKVHHCGNGCTPAVMWPLLTNVDTIVYNATATMQTADVLALVERFPKLEASKRLAHLHIEECPPSATLYKLVYAGLLRPSDTFRTFITKHAAHLLHSHFVSVHARLGTGVLEGGPRFQTNMTPRAMATCLAGRALRMGRELGAKDRTLVLLATDTPDFRGPFRDAVRRLGRGRSAVISGDWGTKHLARLVPEADEDRELFQFSLLELLLLARGEGLVSLKSRFADVGARMGGIDRHVTMDPQVECS